MNIEFKKFISRGFLFLSPILIFFGISFYILSVSGELEPQSTIIERQKNPNTPVLVGMVYSTLPRYLKLNSVLARKPEIIVMGSSRSNQIRAAFFKSPDKFYNAQIGGSVIEDYNIFLDNIPVDKQPKVILIGLHPEFFDNSCRQVDINGIKSIKQEYSPEFGKAIPLKAWQYGYKQLYIDYFAGKFGLNDLFKLGKDSNKVGLNAVIHDRGYRNDGSYIDSRVMANLLTHPREESYKDVFKNEYFNNEIKKTCLENYAYAINQVNEFLKTSKSRDIYVIGFIPPLATIINKTMATDKRFDYQRNLNSDLKSLFDGYKFGFYNFMDFSRIDPEDKEMIDATHGSEKTMLRIVISMVSKDSVLKNYADINFLKNLLKNSKNNFFVF